VSDAVLGILKNCVLALLFLFLLRVVLVVAAELRGTPQLTGDAPRGRRRNVTVAERAPEPMPVAPTPGEAPAVRGRWRLALVTAAGRREFVVNDESTIGRGGGCAIALPDDTFVSTLHARVFLHEGELWLEDLGSTNGTRVDGAPISTAVRLRKGSEVRIGNTSFEVLR
jgi:hypothetical protein